MGVFYSLSEIRHPFKKAVVTIGNFDGVHVGHKALFDHIKQLAKEMDGESVVVTFDPHPLAVVHSASILPPPMINSLEQRLELVREYGIDHVVVIPFTVEFSRIRARDFVEGILCRCLGMKAIVIGHDYAFGYKREGNLELLLRMSEEQDFRVVRMDAVEFEGERVSSTTIRHLIKQGGMEKVRKFLGRPFQMRGKVVPGRKVGGAVLGFPTANMETGQEIMPGQGVYVVEVILRGKTYAGVCNVGYNPTFGLERLSVEAYLFDFNENIYGERIQINFLHKLRNEMKFSSVQELSEQIARDVEEARAYFGGRSIEAGERTQRLQAPLSPSN
ncbi:MAG: bifunctional riboflavin kinase/FAD synthetase [Deltaproteobacteria bacterium]|nr:bifunctional riboflavin kinase/FAD synthetase [Deltaproteobacteria bacterium]